VSRDEVGLSAPPMRFAHFSFNPLRDLLGEGPLSEVYRARDEKLGRTVALKILRPHVDLDPEADKRFEREARHTSNLAHPNIATIYEYGEDSGRGYIAMEFLQGRTLDKIVRDQQLGVEEALRIAVQLTSALALVHRAGMIHRDLKPANVMVQDDGTIKLLDFGIARANGEPTITQHGMLVGTVLYMSPEQVRGDELDPRADIFSLGAMLYHALTGQLPFPGNSFPEVCMSILEGHPRPVGELRSGLPRELADFVMRCLDPDPAKRFQNAGEAHGALMAVADGLATRQAAQAAPHLSGHLALAPIEVAAAPLRGLAAGVRQDISAAMQRSGLAITLLEGNAQSSDLRADYLLRGRLAISGDETRLELGLEVAGESGEPWTLRLEKEHDDEWGLQDTLVRLAVRDLRRRLGELAMRPRAEPKKRNPEAAKRLAELGRSTLHKGMSKHLVRAVMLFRRALEEDGHCAAAYAGLAEALARKYLYWDGDASFLDEARDDARRATAIDPACAAAHTALGYAAQLSGALEDAQREYRLAIQLDHDDWLAHRMLGSILALKGNFKGASPLLQRAIGIRPESIGAYDLLHNVLQRLDRYQEAIETADRGIAAARKRLAQVPDDQDARMHLARLLARMGLRDEAQVELDAATAIGQKDGFTLFHVAVVQALLGNLQEAIRSLAAAEARGYYVKSEASSAEFDVLRGLPEFKALGA
jgi:tetratricopeptide (TPR) repeat protein/predicted Ser/Thr protein kinase